ncbi:ATP-binding protein [Brucella sp. NBRC 12950]|uniref:ATP-binding protein n=1 Tax=Brucella sp. NBRC 12950 TaxID=2994518 RepID=UPI0024A3A213|nr:ATP-binding protein [Brucella sp. NBRC 12950]GLU29949.1 hypothetical protein Brsp01_51820 [Brucella sp. NBRC 12950]
MNKLEPTASAASSSVAGEVNEARYRALFEAIDDGFCIIEFRTDNSGEFCDYIHVEANAGYERHTGIPNIVGKSVHEVAASDAKEWIDLYGNVLRTGERIRFEREFRDAGRHIEVSASRVEPATLNQVSVLFRDVTARKTAEAELKASETRARDDATRVQLALSAGAIIGTWSWDVRNDRVTIDEPFTIAFGLDRNGVEGGPHLKELLESVHAEDRMKLAVAIDKTIEVGGSFSHQYRVRRADGNYYWLEANGRVDRDAEGTELNFSGVLIDLEGRRAIEEERDRVTSMLRDLNETLEHRVSQQTAELMAREEELRQSQKMEAVGQLTGGLAHDFNNLLAGISGSLEMIRTRIAQGRTAELGRYLEGAQGAVKRAAALTHRLLAFSRRQTLDPKPTNIDRLTLDLQELVQRTVGPQIIVETSSDESLWSTLVDPNQLENVVLNLCLNARDAMPGGGRISIRTFNQQINDDLARQHKVRGGEYVVMQVSDTGVGMTADVVEKAFDPFFTTKPIGVGTGLGLSMIYGFARQSGGYAKIDSQLGQGTQVSVFLPRHSEKEEQQIELNRETMPMMATRQQVLVIDDEPLVRMLIVDAVEELGLEPLEAGDGPSALSILQSDVQIDLMITDVGLPNGMNGRQVADAARELRAGLKVLFVTGYAENSILGAGQMEAGMEVMTKPFDMVDLGRRIKSMLEAS